MLQKIPIPDKIVEALLCDFNKVSHLTTKRTKEEKNIKLKVSDRGTKGISLRGVTTDVEETDATRRVEERLKKNYTKGTLLLIQKLFYPLQKNLLIH